MTAPEKPAPTIKMSYIPGLPDPYLDFDYTGYVLDLQGWGSQTPLFKSLIQQTNPTLVIEVGTWKGASAIHMASILKELGMTDARIICVDHWLGSAEMWTDLHDKDRHLSLKLKNGYPTLYYQFLANVCLSGLQGFIQPLPNSSLGASIILSHYKIRADLIYIDAGHDYAGVTADLNAYWPLLRPGGVIFGDDYSVAWPGVAKGVNRFALDNNLHVGFLDDKWWITKGVDHRQRPQEIDP